MHFRYYIAFVVLLLGTPSCSSKIEYLPADISGLTLVNRLTGDDAGEFVNNLHFEPVADTKNEIGFYQSETGSAVIYIAHYNNKVEADNNYKKMTGKISKGTSVFIKPGYIYINEHKIFRCFGMGQSHFVFTLDKELYWVTADTFIGKSFVEKYLDFIDEYYK